MANTTAAWTRYVSGDYDRAIEHCQHTLELDPEFVPARRVLGAALLQGGRPLRVRARRWSGGADQRSDRNPVLAWLAHVQAVDGARTEARELIARAHVARSAVRYVPAFHLALAYAGLEDHDRAFAALDQAWLDRDPALATLDGRAAIRSAARRPAVSALLDRMNIPDPVPGTRDSGVRQT